MSLLFVSDKKQDASYILKSVLRLPKPCLQLLPQFISLQFLNTLMEGKAFIFLENYYAFASQMNVDSVLKP